MNESKFVREIFAEEFQEGMLQVRRASIREVLEECFGKETAETFTPLLAAITDQTQLSRLLRLAVRCAGPEEFRTGLTQR